MGGAAGAMAPLSVATWAEEWRGRHVHFYCDATVCVDGLKGFRSGSADIQAEWRALAMLLALNSIKLTIEYLPGPQNEVADAVSRRMFDPSDRANDELTKLAPHLAESPEEPVLPPSFDD